jgi:hypothetical protein
MNPEFIFETILFIHGVPSYYNVFHLNGYFIYEPIPHHFYSSMIFPELVAIKQNDSWNVFGSIDRKLIEPLVKELETHLTSIASTFRVLAASQHI